jgi:hypothetical protein
MAMGIIMTIGAIMIITDTMGTGTTVAGGIMA